MLDELLQEIELVQRRGFHVELACELTGSHDGFTLTVWGPPGLFGTIRLDDSGDELLNAVQTIIALKKVALGGGAGENPLSEVLGAPLAETAGLLGIPSSILSDASPSNYSSGKIWIEWEAGNLIGAQQAQLVRRDLETARCASRGPFSATSTGASGSWPTSASSGLPRSPLGCIARRSDDAARPTSASSPDRPKG